MRQPERQNNVTENIGSDDKDTISYAGERFLPVCTYLDTRRGPVPCGIDPIQCSSAQVLKCSRYAYVFNEVVHLTIPDPAEQAPLVARSVTPPSPSGRGGTTLLLQRAPQSCTVFVMTPPNEHTSEGGRDDRGVLYHAEPTLSSAQVLKMMTTESRKF